VSLARCLSTFMFQSTYPHGTSSSLAGGRFTPARSLEHQGSPYGLAPTVPLFQSTRPRGARSTFCRHQRLIADRISIHAPTRGATSTLSKYLPGMSVFQPTHPDEARLTQLCIMSQLYIFQSTGPCGVQQKLAKTCGHLRQVSIHAPAWERTLRRRCSWP
jgi:hypothetical protein